MHPAEGRQPAAIKPRRRTAFNLGTTWAASRITSSGKVPRLCPKPGPFYGIWMQPQRRSLWKWWSH